VNPEAEVSVMKLDLSSLKSVRQLASDVRERETVVDMLINNAGVMMTPEWKTEDGFEMQFGTNHLGMCHTFIYFLININI
jgi:retinol dehydrogenase-12